MSKDYNCFKCQGYNIMCPEYFGLKEQNICVYRAVANNDLKKFNEGRRDLTLIDMLEQYLDIKKIVMDNGKKFNGEKE